MAHMVFVEEGRLVHRTLEEVVVQHPDGRVEIVKLPDVWISLTSGAVQKRRCEWIYPRAPQRGTHRAPLSVADRVGSFCQGAAVGAVGLFFGLLVAGFAH